MSNTLVERLKQAEGLLQEVVDEVVLCSSGTIESIDAFLKDETDEYNTPTMYVLGKYLMKADRFDDTDRSIWGVAEVVYVDHCIELVEALRREHLATDGTPLCNIMRGDEPSPLNVDNCVACKILAKWPEKM